MIRISTGKRPESAPDPVKGHTSVGQLAWMTLLIGVAVEPHAGSVDTWVLAALAGALLWRIGAALWHWKLPNTLLRAALTLTGSFAVVYTYRRISGLDAGSALLILMLALKLIETHSTRDRSIVILIAWFVLFASFLREQSVMSIPQLAGGVVIGTLALLQSARPDALLTPGRALQLTGRLLLQAVPLALALFLLFPRLPGPFWALPSAGGGGRTGLSDQMSPGDITSLAQSDEVAFRVRFTGLPPAPGELYWRGPVLERFDGRRWSTQPDPARDRTGPDRDYASRAAAGQRLYSYEITLEPNQQALAAAAGNPTQLGRTGQQAHRHARVAAKTAHRPAHGVEGPICSTRQFRGCAGTTTSELRPAGER